jgi:hypothetical protein
MLMRRSAPKAESASGRSVFFKVKLRPVCSRSYLRVLACQKWGRYFLPREGQKIFRSRAKRRVLTGSGRCDNSCFAGTGRGTGFFRSEQGTGLKGRGRQRQGHGFTGYDMPGGEAPRKRLGEGEQRASSEPAGNDTACVEFSYVYRLGTSPEGGPEYFGPLWGCKTNTGVCLNNSWQIPDIISLTI